MLSGWHATTGGGSSYRPTVGYGDFDPVSAAGHVVGAYVIVGGIVALTILFTQLASVIAVRDAHGLQVSPGWDTAIRGGSVLYYLATGRIDESRLAAAR